MTCMKSIPEVEVVTDQSRFFWKRRNGAETVRSFWQKHPGADAYSLFWLVLVLVLGGLGRFYPPLFIPAGVALLYLIFRLFSRKGEKRQVENARFLALAASVRGWFQKKKGGIQQDKSYAYFKCPTCGQAMRIPKGLGTVEITCRSCSALFQTKS